MLAAVFLVLGGCVERRLRIESEPSGAIVYVSDVEVGRTPLTLPFTWYGDYDIMLRKEGYATLKTHEPIAPPWYDMPPLDLFSAVAPWTYRVRREFRYELRESDIPRDAELIGRARELQEKNLQPAE